MTFVFIEPKWKWLSKRRTKTCYPNTLKGWWDCGWGMLQLSSFNFFMSCQVSKFAYLHFIYKPYCLLFLAVSCLKVIMPLFISFNFDESYYFDFSMPLLLLRKSSCLHAKLNVMVSQWKYILRSRHLYENYHGRYSVDRVLDYLSSNIHILQLFLHYHADMKFNNN